MIMGLHIDVELFCDGCERKLEGAEFRRAEDVQPAQRGWADKYGTFIPVSGHPISTAILKYYCRTCEKTRAAAKATGKTRRAD